MAAVGLEIGIELHHAELARQAAHQPCRGRRVDRRDRLARRLHLDSRTYEKGIKITDAEMAALDIRGDTFHPEWNYTVQPRPTKL
jgi:hypothetical protein